MLTIRVTTEENVRRVIDAAAKAAFRNYRHAAASISKDVKASLVKADGPSTPGSPPHTHRGTYLRRAVRYAADAQGAVIGPTASIVGGSGAAHEFGGSFKDSEYPARPFMLPALERAAPRFAGEWRGSIGE